MTSWNDTMQAATLTVRLDTILGAAAPGPQAVWRTEKPADQACQGDPGVVAEPGKARSHQDPMFEGKVVAKPMDSEWGMLLLAAALSLAWGLLVAL